jgi:hypothetical protein
MLSTYSHTRAAILCFGGWGLQTAFHLLPRLQAAQEQRAALHALGPDLGDVTRIGALFPEWALDADDVARFSLYTHALDGELPPYLAERLLEDLVLDFESVPMTSSEVRADGLRNALLPYLVDVTPPAWHKVLPTRRRAGRRHLFDAAARLSEPTVRLLETHVVDPIRVDNLDPDDPFVQTTLYVIAPLFEPQASALVWPVVAQLMARMGRRHISQVVGMFATGSYAIDQTRPMEDGASYATLTELEALSGLRGLDNESLAAWRNFVGAADPALAEQVGAQLFDFIYLLDREKTNQSLAHDSHELAVMACNALEAMIVGGGNLYIQEQLGIGLRVGDGRPYSLIGAAGDYVPVSQVLHAISRQEESRLVREWVLRSTPTAPNPLVRTAKPPVFSTLEELGFDQAHALAPVTARLPNLFEMKTPQSVDDLAVAHDYVWPEALSGAPVRAVPEDWPDAFAEHMADLQEHVSLVTGATALSAEWGLDASRRFGDMIGPEEPLVPATVQQMHKQLLELLVAAPTGLNSAQRQVQQWLGEAERMRRQLEAQNTPAVQRLTQIQQNTALRDWLAAYRKATLRTPQLAYVVLRALFAIALVAGIAWLYLFFTDGAWDWTGDGLTLAGFGTGVMIAGLLSYSVHTTRARRLRERRILLAQEELTAQLRANVRAGLLSAIDRVLVQLRGWSEMLADARHELHALSSPPERALEPPDPALRYLYAPHAGDTLVGDCTTFLQSQLDAEGRRIEDRLDVLWGDAEWRGAMQRILRGAPALSGAAAARQARSLAEYIRQTVRASVAPASLERLSPARAKLIRELARTHSIEHQLWRAQADEHAIEQQLRALTNGQVYVPPARIDQNMLRRYIDGVWNRAKPSANYDVSDRLAVYAIAIDFVAAAGTTDSDLTHALSGEFNLTLLPTQDPFSVFFVRTIHGIGRHDLDSMRRYRGEFHALTPDERALIVIEPAGVPVE